MPQHAESANTGKSSRGFASMDPAKQREIARKGGESVPNEKRSFSQNRELAATAGRKGGEASQGARRQPLSPTPAANR
jgi:general stress protein YciG